MGSITKNISDHELRCQCGKCNVRIQDHEPVIQVVQDVCDYLAISARIDKVVLVITSAGRCYEYNRCDSVGSNDESQHPRCNAMDIKIFIDGQQVPTQDIHNYLCSKYPDKYGFGLYNSFNHIDTRAKKSRW